MSEKYSPEEIAKAHKILYNEGIKMRYQVAGKEYVDKALANADNPFSRAMQEVSRQPIPFLPSNHPPPPSSPILASLTLSKYVSESCWGSIWTRPGLDLKVRSFLNIVMLCCQNRSQELATHVKGAMNNGATEEEVREVVLQAACYCGMPAGMEVSCSSLYSSLGDGVSGVRVWC
jgi:4-carboxymuconolactone decarboxylase